MLVAISEPGFTSRKKVPLGIRLKSTRPSEIRVSLHVTAHRGENQKLRRGCTTAIEEQVSGFGEAAAGLSWL